MNPEDPPAVLKRSSRTCPRVRFDIDGHGEQLAGANVSETEKRQRHQKKGEARGEDDARGAGDGDLSSRHTRQGASLLEVGLPLMCGCCLEGWIR